MRQMMSLRPLTPRQQSRMCHVTGHDLVLERDKRQGAKLGNSEVTSVWSHHLSDLDDQRCDVEKLIHDVESDASAVVPGAVLLQEDQQVTKIQPATIQLVHHWSIKDNIQTGDV